MTETEHATHLAEWITSLEVAILPADPAKCVANVRALIPASIDARLIVINEFLEIAATCPPRPVGTTPELAALRSRIADFSDDRVHHALDYLEATLGGFADLHAQFPDPETPERTAYANRLRMILSRLWQLPLPPDESAYMTVRMFMASRGPFVPPLVSATPETTT